MSEWTVNYPVKLFAWNVNYPVHMSTLYMDCYLFRKGAAWPVNCPVHLVRESVVFVDQNRMTGNRRQEGDWNIEESIGKIQIINVHIN